MKNLSLLNGCDLHLHVLGAYHAEDLLELGRDCYRDVNWNEFDFIESYKNVYGNDPRPIALFDDAVKNGKDGIEKLKRAYTYS